ncbi:hypothetical protein LINGRAHAP2_LOCUS8157 [Linum grandiflorum]
MACSRSVLPYVKKLAGIKGTEIECNWGDLFGIKGKEEINFGRNLIVDFH